MAEGDFGFVPRAPRAEHLDSAAPLATAGGGGGGARHAAAWEKLLLFSGGRPLTSRQSVDVTSRGYGRQSCSEGEDREGDSPAQHMVGDEIGGVGQVHSESVRAEAIR